MRFPLLLCFLLLMVQCCLAEPLKREELAGRNVAIWQPVKTSKAPIVIFSHGFHGINSQSAHLMGVLAKAGYFVVAPNHGDYLFNKDGANSAPQQSFDSPEKWTEDTYRDRANDLAEIFSALKAHPVYKEAFDPGRLVLMGHSLGGYTILGISGAWPSWNPAGMQPRAIVCFSPYLSPYLTNKNLSHLWAPVMYQGGTLDSYISPKVSRPGGAFEQSSFPKLYVEFEGAAHLAWTSVQRGHQAIIEQYTLAFLDHYVLAKPPALILKKAPKGVSDLRYRP
jgi:dienelactone hydrolase